MWPPGKHAIVFDAGPMPSKLTGPSAYGRVKVSPTAWNDLPSSLLHSAPPPVRRALRSDPPCHSQSRVRVFFGHQHGSGFARPRCPVRRDVHTRIQRQSIRGSMRRVSACALDADGLRLALTQGEMRRPDSLGAREEAHAVFPERATQPLVGTLPRNQAESM